MLKEEQKLPVDVRGSKTSVLKLSSGYLKLPVVLQRTAKKCTKIQNPRAQLLFRSSNLLFGDVSVAVAVVVC